MSNDLNKLEAMLREHKFVLIRTSKHKVYQNPDGRNIVLPSTPSDWRWVKNKIAQLKRVLASPAQSLILTISDYERDEAASLIQGQERPVVGMKGAGKQKRSRGTGYKYEDEKVLTEADLAQRELIVQQAIANQRRRAQEEKDRRQRKLERRAAIAAEEEKNELAFQQSKGAILKAWKADVIETNGYFLQLCDQMIACPWWTRESLYELSDDEFHHRGSANRGHHHTRSTIRAEAKRLRRDGIFTDDMNFIMKTFDEAVEEDRQDYAGYRDRSQERVNALIRLAEKHLRESNSITDLLATIWKRGEEMDEKGIQYDRSTVLDHALDCFWRFIVNCVQGAGTGIYTVTQIEVDENGVLIFDSANSFEEAKSKRSEDVNKVFNEYRQDDLEYEQEKQQKTAMSLEEANQLAAAWSCE